MGRILIVFDTKGGSTKEIIGWIREGAMSRGAIVDMKTPNSGHPEGTVSGARAMFQAVEAWKEGKSLEEFSKNHRELALALQKWGPSN